MKQSIFKKEVAATGLQGTFTASIVATMNYDSKTISGTHAATHDDFIKQIPVHKITCFINGKTFKEVSEIQSESVLYAESQRMIILAQKEVEELANHEPVQSFGEKMIELFS